MCTSESCFNIMTLHWVTLKKLSVIPIHLSIFLSCHKAKIQNKTWTAWSKKDVKIRMVISLLCSTLHGDSTISPNLTFHWFPSLAKISRLRDVWIQANKWEQGSLFQVIRCVVLNIARNEIFLLLVKSEVCIHSLDLCYAICFKDVTFQEGCCGSKKRKVVRK